MNTDIEIEVAADADVPLHVSDPAHSFTTGGTVGFGYLTAAAGTNLAFAARFQDVPIPRTARIRSAVIRLEPPGGIAEVVVNARIDGLLVGNSETPTHAEFDGGVVGAVSHGRNTNNRTRAQIAWTNVPATVNGVDFDTPDISLIVQEIIGHPEWAEGNAMTYFIGDEDQESDQEDTHLRTARHTGPGPRLIVTFSVTEDPATYEVSLGAVPQTLTRLAAAKLREDMQVQVE